MNKLLILFYFISSSSIYGQNISKSVLDSMPIVQNLQKLNFIPITYAKPGTEYKTEYKLSGVIIEQSSAGFYCGTSCHSGTMKVRINEKLNQDFSSFIYVLVPCFVHNNADNGKKIELTVTNLPEDRDIGCYINVWNTINSNRQFFYYCEKYKIK